MVSSNPASGTRYGDNELGNITQKQNQLKITIIKLETRIDYVSMLKMFPVYVSKLIITQDTAYFQEKLGKLQKGWTKCPNEHLGVKFKFK